jgi:hypothetical protein
MSENENAANELLAQGQSVVSAKAEDIIAGLSSVKEVDLLKAALIAEQAGKGRATVIKALDNAIAGLEAPDGGDALNQADEADARARAEAEAERVAGLERREQDVVEREEAVARAEADLADRIATLNALPAKQIIADNKGNDDGANVAPEIDTSDHVDMYLDKPHFEGGPTEALVHPDEVENYTAGGWKEA